jgi:hypothetical protein
VETQEEDRAMKGFSYRWVPAIATAVGLTVASSSHALVEITAHEYTFIRGTGMPA